MYSNLLSLKKISLLLVFFLSLTYLGAQQNLDKDNVAVSGYDVVGYFANTAIKGKHTFSVYHNNATYLFHNKDNKAAFKANPEKYIPQYGGWCAYAMGHSGDKVSINPESFTIEDEKLYLFYKTTFVNTRKKWKENTEHLKTKANKNWKKTQSK